MLFKMAMWLFSGSPCNYRSLRVFCHCERRRRVAISCGVLRVIASESEAIPRHFERSEKSHTAYVGLYEIPRLAVLARDDTSCQIASSALSGLLAMTVEKVLAMTEKKTSSQ